MKPYDHVYLSPHFDDAVFSCGGAIHQQRRRGEAVLVVTVCAAVPDATLSFSSVAERLHALMGSPEEVVALRRAEDRAALARLGADGLWLGVTDCIYRRAGRGSWYYTSLPEVFGRVHPGDEALAAEIATAVQEKVAGGPQTTLYAPLTVGGHVDHQVVHRAARVLRAHGWRVVFFEDYPYAEPDHPHPLDPANTSTLAATVAAWPSLAPRSIRLSEDDMQAKIDGAGAYRSQVAMLFGDEEALAGRLRAYALHACGSYPAERFWIPG